MIFLILYQKKIKAAEEEEPINAADAEEEADQFFDEYLEKQLPMLERLDLVKSLKHAIKLLWLKLLTLSVKPL